MIWRHWGCHPLPTKNPQVFVKLWGARRDRGHCGGAPGRRDDRVGRGATGIHAGTQSAPGAATVSIHRALEALEGMKPGPVGRFLLGRGFIVLTGTMIVKHKCIYMYIYMCIYIYTYTIMYGHMCVCIEVHICVWWVAQPEIPLFQVENGTDSSDAVPLVTQRAYWNGEFAGDQISGPIVLHSSGSSRLLGQWPVEPALD